MSNKSGGVWPVASFRCALPYTNLFGIGVLTVIIGLVFASAVSAIPVYAQELEPGNVGPISRLFFELPSGSRASDSAALGYVTDRESLLEV